MRDYGKVHSSFWSSETTRSMTEDGRHLALYLMTCSHNTIAGVFRLPDGYVCEDIQWTAERVKQAFLELFDKGFANRCETTKWVWINKHLEWNPPENPNQRKSAAKIAQSIPDECGWKQEFMGKYGEVLALECTAFLKPLDNPSLTLSQSGTGTGTEETPIRPQPSATDPSADGIPDCPHQAIIALYGEKLAELTQPRSWDGARAANLKARWRWVLTAKKPSGQRYATTADEALAFFGRMFAYVAESDFLMGRSGKWMCDLPWLVKAENFSKVIEGRYENRTGETA